MSSLSVVIPSKNGRDLLREFLPEIIRETRRAQGELIVVDDCSTDFTAEMITEEYPSVRLLKRTGQSAFCRAVNLGMEKASGKYLMVLNNDTIPEKGSFTILLDSLKSCSASTAVAVPSIPRPDGSDDSLFSWSFRKGLAVTCQSAEGNSYPSGACAVWKREVWEKLGGLDDRYAPIYWEDTDLGARMHEAGYLMERFPEAVVRHVHGATMGHSLETLILRERNRFIFMAAHCTSCSEKFQTMLWFPLHAAMSILKGDRSFLSGYRAWREWRKSN